jgi:hypothetical protein
VNQVAEDKKIAVEVDVANLKDSISRFTDWLDGYGEVSYDHQSYFASPLGRKAKGLYYSHPILGMLAVAPMILSEAFVPSARRLFWKPQRFPIADAHYAMGYAYLFQVSSEKKHYDRAVHFLRVLIETRSPGYEHYGWGYPFDWETRQGTMKAGTPLITTVPYVYEAFSQMYAVDGNSEWKAILESIAEHAASDYHEVATSEQARSCSYNPEPNEPCGVINASAYRSFLLTKASVELNEPRYREIADRNLNFVLESQNPDGSWFYSNDGTRDFVDHFHTCFVMKALAKIEAITGDRRCTTALERGVGYYLRNLFDEEGYPKPFSRRPRMTVYKRELYDYAECLNLCVLLRGRFPELDQTLSRLSRLGDWQKKDGSFRARLLFLGWDNTPMHRWAQAQMFCSLSFLLAVSSKSAQ